VQNPGGIAQHLAQRFAQQRVVIWHDPDGDYAPDLDEVALRDVTVLRVANNEFGLKHRILRGEPDAKFLVYRTGPIPQGIDDWLLDLELAYGVFTADRATLLRQDLGLTPTRDSQDAIDTALEQHSTFFRSAKRTAALKGLLHATDTADQLRTKMCAVLLGVTDASLIEFTRALLVENAARQDTKYQALVEHGLDTHYWKLVAREYRYTADHPTVDDFILWTFRQAISHFASDTPDGLRGIQLAFNTLRNDRRSADQLKALARRAEHDLDYAATIEDADLADLTDDDIFEQTEQKIVSGLANAVISRTLGAQDVSHIIHRRQTSLWAEPYQDLYAAIRAASDLLTKLTTDTFETPTFDDGLQRYRDDWYRIDQLYRHFQLAVRRAPTSGPLDALREEVEKRYVNTYLYQLGGNWQQQVDAVDVWRSDALQPQASFFRARVAPIVHKGGRKAVVIVSDALRYEIADELGTRVREQDRFDATLEAMLGVLPSYTQLGMAALLPHKTLAHSPHGDPVLVDGQPSNGTQNRTKILAAVDGVWISAEDVLAMSQSELREFYTQHRVFYISHNRIDATGDEAGTERQVFEAAEDALDELLKLVSRLASANATNIIVTADHGFLYQDSPLAETSYLSTLPQGDDIVMKKRRFVLGRGLKDDPAFRTFEPRQIGLDGDLQVQLPKSIHRLKLPGAGSRYVHGGAALQEIVVPVLSINKKRRSDVRPVNVEILPDTNRITTGQLVVKLYQSEPVNEKVQPRSLRAGLYAGETLLSNQVTLVFDQASPDKRDRYQSARMLLSPDADALNGRSVEFRLEEQIPRTTQWRTYQRAQYTLRRSFTTDFDF
jgi:uncharacterized protein (TIGR02687 family)